MLRKSTHAHSRRFGSSLALALALAAGGLLGTTVAATPAMAKDEKPKEEKNSKAFAKAYEPYAAIVNSADGDFAAAKAMIPSVQASVENDQDRYILGNSLVALGGKLEETDVQKQGLEMILASGKAPAEQVGLYNYYLARFANEAKDYVKARQYYQASADAGYTEGLPDVLIADTYFNNNQAGEGLTYLANLLDKRAAAGQQVDDQWIVRGLKVAVDNGMTDQVVDYATRLVAASPTPEHWSDAITLIATTSEPDKQSTLDILRLMRATGALSQRNQYVEYVETAADTGLPSEVLGVLADGKAAGIFQDNGDDYYSEALALAKTRSANDASDAPSVAAEAQSSSTGVTAQGAGDLFFSLGDYAKAADMYKLAVEKGARDRELAVVRQGIAQILAGDVTGGKSTLSQVAGTRAAIAKLWIAYADSKA